MSARLFHITTREEWEQAAAAGEYRAPSLETAGFIHLSHERQWLGVANRLFRGRSGLVLLSIDPARLGGEVREEDADGDRFPHLYGPLNTDAVVGVSSLPVAADGSIGLPVGLEARRPAR